MAHPRRSGEAYSLLLLAGMLQGAVTGLADDRPSVDLSDLPEHELTGGPYPPAAGSLTLPMLLARYREAVEGMQYQEAETAAKQRIEHLLVTGTSSGYEMADALIDLAFAQRQIEQYDAAIQNYIGSIVILEDTDDMLSERLVAPLRGIGETYVASGEAELAVPVYERALHVNHVNAGPHNLQQLDLLDAMIDAMVQAGREDAALSTVERISSLYARRYATDSEEMLPALWRRAGLLKNMGRYQDERLVYLDIVRIIEKHHGDRDVSLIKPYTELGRTYLQEVDQAIFRSEPTAQTGETYLKRAVEVARENDADINVQLATLIDLADYYTILNVQDKARRHYRAAWSLLSEDERVADRDEIFDSMVVLVQPKLDAQANFGYRSRVDDAAAQTEGFMLAQFSINERGRVTDIEIIEADPPEFPEMETRLERTLRDSVYRPRYENGNPVKSHENRMRHDFVYTDQASAAWQDSKP
jgi:tetratricopeptide (TPR) repeat protein